MAISPFSARPVSPGSESRRARVALVLAAVGIAAILLAYAISPGVRHVVSHAEHSVKHAVGHMLDPDRESRAHRASRAHARAVRPPPAHATRGG
ncbi:MAG TPA: hypothetical protein VGY13_08335 [Solirubrobacteraceae bacterium]|jgi:hypothetical protein|nr:hypothetical protein [Solirubrobacteraceae bacterium]